jgi:plasmid stabilization system protein ParE
VPSLIWTPRALADLARLHRFLVEKNPDAARQAVRAARRGMRPLAAHPEAGRPAAGMDPEFREWWIPFGSSGYLALYRLDGRRVVVLAVRHGRELGF